MKKRIFALVLCLALTLSLGAGAFAASGIEPTDAALALYNYGLFKGTGTDAAGKPVFDLDRAPTRAEAVTMLVRLLGKESAAQAGSWTLPFTDVPNWAVPYVGYAYDAGLTNGVSATEFGTAQNATATMYLTFVLRALGYQSGEDFRWDAAWELTDALGITDGRYNAATNTAFLRGDAAVISFDALDAGYKDGSTTLLGALAAAGAIRTPGAEEPDVSSGELPASNVRFGDNMGMGFYSLWWDAPGGAEGKYGYDVYFRHGGVWDETPYASCYPYSLPYIDMRFGVIPERREKNKSITWTDADRVRIVTWPSDEVESETHTSLGVYETAIKTELVMVDPTETVTEVRVAFDRTEQLIFDTEPRDVYTVTISGVKPAPNKFYFFDFRSADGVYGGYLLGAMKTPPYEDDVFVNEVGTYSVEHLPDAVVNMDAYSVTIDPADHKHIIWEYSVIADDLPMDGILVME